MINWYQTQIVGPVRELAKQYGTERSPEWRKVRGIFIKEHPFCAVCNRKDLQINVHHVIPFHIHPELELDPENLITLCRDHHFFLGHLMSWKSWNENIREDAAFWNEKIKKRPSKKNH